jgi:5-methylthioadenosine/S-adenosylhomocysteine deaminase
MTAKKILIKNVEIISNGPAYKKVNIGITGTKITAISTRNIPGYKDATVIDGTNKIAVPGMINAHTHAAMTLLRSYADDMALMDWLNKMIWPAEANLTPADIYWGTQLAILEMMQSGTTAFADMYFIMEETARAVEETGFRASLARGLIGAAPDADTKLKENIALYKNWHKKANGRITVMLGPHAPYTCPPAFLKKVKKAADKLGSEIHMHLAETEQEVKDCVKNYGMTPIKFADSFGLLDNGMLAAHCVHVTDEEIALMAKKHVRVVHNPQSNLKLASGIAPVPKMLAKKICVGLGTDGASSNNNLDMLEECRAAAMIHKANTGDPLAVPAKTALQMATVNGAKAIGYKNLGLLKPGYLADIVLYDMEKPYWYPRHDRLSLLVYAANSADADTVIINGKVLMEKGKPLYMDVEKIYAECEARGKRLVGK